MAKKITREVLRAQARARREAKEKKASKPRRTARDRKDGVERLRLGGTSPVLRNFEGKVIDGKTEAAPKKPRSPKKVKDDTSFLSGTFEKELPVELNPEEIADKHEQTTKIHQQIKEQRAKAKEATKEMTAKIKRSEERRVGKECS